ncbi:MAG: DegT/DnrJ/EryC1/StrS aminotransferase family protein [Phycisphaerales bacterium]|nr:DegT/DnrJ/EryC1/StrS aminotransferase family protein [Phycisphaerales bacterium]
MKYDIPLSKPDLTDEDRDAVLATLRGSRLTMGSALLEFEAHLATVVRRPFAIGVSSAGAGLEICLRALCIGPGDEVLVPALSFASNVNAVIAVGARAVFVDCDPRSLNMRVFDAERLVTPKTKAVLGVPVLGNPAGLPELIRFCSRFEIPMVEHASEGLGSTIGSDNVGKFGRLSVFGFGPNRPIAAGEGGAIVTNDDRLAAACRALRNQGRVDRQSFPDQSPDLGMIMTHASMGLDARLAEPLAALASSQLRRLDEIRSRRIEVAAAYTRTLAGHPDLILPNVLENSQICWPLFWVRLSDRFGLHDRDAVITGLHRHDVGAANHYPPAHLLPHVQTLFGTKVGDCPAAESIGDRMVTLPMFTSMTAREVGLVCQALEVVLSRGGVERGS